MKDFQPKMDSKLDYGLFLIRKTSFVSPDFLAALFKTSSDNLVSFERLFKGNKCTLLIYGPKNILARFNIDLDLLEMEDYTQNINIDSIHAWEFGLRGDLEEIGNLFEDFPKLSRTDEIFWQIILKPTFKKGQLQLKGNIRTVILSDDPPSIFKLAQSIQNLAPLKLIKLPKSYSNQQIMNFYRERILGPTKQNFSLEQVLKLIKVS